MSLVFPDGRWHGGKLLVATCLWVIASSIWFTGSARAQTEVGCCAFTVSSRVPARRCADLTRAQCDSLRPYATFFRGQRCDSGRQRCMLFTGTAPASSPTPTATATPTVETPTPTATPEPAGCCEVAASRAVPFPICGNDVNRARCLTEFGTRGSFCENCRCASHDRPGFSILPGGCVTLTPTPTHSPTRTPTTQRTPRGTPPRAVPTPTPTAGEGCCEVPVSENRAFCGNRISRAACLQQFPGALFCADCFCSSHSAAGFGTTKGKCLRRVRQPRPPRAPLAPRVPRR